MSIYRYNAISANGQKIQGTVFVESYNDAYNYLYARKWYPISIQKAKLFSGKINTEDLLNFFLHMDLQLKCKVRVDEAIESFLEVHGNKILKSSLESIIYELKRGVSLGEAFKMHTSIFDDIIIALLKSAEKTGNVSEIVESILNFLKMQNDWKNNVRKAIGHPIFILLFVLSMLAFSAIFLGPQIISLMQSLGVDEVPIITQITMNVLKIIPTFIIFFISAIFFFIPFLFSRKGRLVFWKLVLKFPIFGKLIINLNFWQFSKIFHIALDAKLDFINAFNLAIGAMKLDILKQELLAVNKKINDGYSISESFANVKFVPSSVIFAIDIGGGSNNLSRSFNQLSKKQYIEILMNINRIGQHLSDSIKLLAGLILILIICAFLLPIYNYIEIAGT